MYFVSHSVAEAEMKITVTWTVHDLYMQNRENQHETRSKVKVHVHIVFLQKI